MNVGIGLPITIPGVAGKTLIEWARRADAGPFSSLGVIDRIVYPNYEPLISLAAVAAVTERIRLMPAVLLAPLRPPGLLAKEAATIDAISNGRLTLGLGVGMRPDDYAAVPASFRNRGKRFDEQLEIMHRIWAGEPVSGDAGPVGPKPVQPGGPEILIGGSTPAAIGRVARWGSGYIAGGGGPQRAQGNYQVAAQAWQEAGRSGKPRFAALAYAGLGPKADDQGRGYVRDYYGWLGDAANGVAQSALTTPDAVKGAIQAFTDAGCDELILMPILSDPEQVDRFGEIVG